ncbi:Hypothetical protein CINCED_3A007453 [Cinara cedri]|nr:Hypothetical protein CINCED_3A007453 [Cinara cedri]
MKLLWAPIVDAFYIQAIGRRKSWFVPVQYSMGIFFIYVANNIDDWLPESGKPNIKMILFVFFVSNYFSGTLDIVVDGWALTMLRKNNVNYASTCNGTGMAFGMFIGSICPILLASEDFCNTYLRINPSPGGMVTFKSFLYFWGVVYIIITTLVGIFKKEKDTRLEADHVKINIFQNYKLLLNILKLPSIRTLTLALLTSRIGFSAIEAVSNLKIMDAGVSKEDITVIAMFIDMIQIVIPFFITKYISGPKPMSLYMNILPIKLLWSIVYASFIYYTPVLIQKNGFLNRYFSYNFTLGFIWSVNDVFNYIMSIAIYAFFSRISDPRFGGTYMTLLNTVNTMGLVGPGTIALKLVDSLTFHNCPTEDPDVYYTTTNTKDVYNNEDCELIVDGYYVEIVLCVIIGFIWYCIFNSIVKDLQSRSSLHWKVNVEQTKTKNPFVMTST